MSEKVAVIGMGQMGSGMAGRLRESGLDVIGYDVSADQRTRLARDGFQMASGIAGALAGRTLVLTSLPDPKAVTAAWLGADGIVAHAARGTLCIELSTIDPQTMQRKWTFPQYDVTDSGILTTATDLLFTGGREGYFYALDARTGEVLWKVSLGGQIVNGPMTYAVDGKQYVAVISGNSLYAFGLRD